MVGRRMEMMVRLVSCNAMMKIEKEREERTASNKDCLHRKVTPVGNVCFILVLQAHRGRNDRDSGHW